jgi:F-type H+-transporting ATPase subunit b
VLCAAVGAAVLCAALPVLASEQAAEASPLKDLGWQLLNMAILLAVLVYAGRGPIRSFFVDRGARIRTDLDEAAELLAQAEARYSQWQHKLIELDDELTRLRADARQRAEQEREAILAEAQAAAERIHRDAVATVEQELRRAQAKLRAQAAELATRIAEQILRDRLEDGDRERLMDEFIARIEPAAGERPGGRA